MYKIHINETPLCLASEEEADRLADSGEILSGRYTGKPKHLLPYVDMLEKPHQFDQVLITFGDLPHLWADFCSHFRLIEAAGGVVRNPDDRVLVIFRRGFWDLPKGKIDPGESPEEAAVREVMEETGLEAADLIGFLMPTYHIYREKGRRMLKHTYWFRMEAEQDRLKPQAEEQIERAEWRDLPTFLAEKPRMHANVLELLTYSLSK